MANYELSEDLESITGDSGKSSFNLNDVCASRSLFVIAYNDDGDGNDFGIVTTAIIGS